MAELSKGERLRVRLVVVAFGVCRRLLAGVKGPVASYVARLLAECAEALAGRGGGMVV